VQEAERIASPKVTFRERKRSHRFGGYVALMSSISDAEDYSFEEVDKLQVWKDVTLEEYRSIIKNNVWDNVKTTFLNGKIKHEVFVEKPDGFVLHKKVTHVCKIRKTLYGLKQAPRVWYDRIDGFLKILGFQKSNDDENLYFKVRGNQPFMLIMCFYDLFQTGYEGIIAWCKRELTSEFEMKDLSLMHYFLRLEVWQR
jgi:hypothetical protein